MKLYSAVRKYAGFTKKRREELAPLIVQELAPRLQDNAGVHAFTVRDDETTLTSTTVFQDREAAEAASRRPPTDKQLTPEASVREIEATPRPIGNERTT
jgi:predicted hotdog family 3-hydroxylacyl-ACP dehydratase